MKIISWNIGNFIWAKHLPGYKHYGFQVKDLNYVLNFLKKEDADIIFLQEIDNNISDVELLVNNFKEFGYHLSIRSKDRESVSLFLSKYEIAEVHHTHSNDYVINGITFFPIHLNAFSPKRREDQVNILSSDLPSKRGVILGDTNFWIFKHKFLSSKDKDSYEKIINGHIDILKNLGHTCRIYLALDKIFITKDLKYFNQKIVKHKIGQIDHYLISADIEV